MWYHPKMFILFDKNTGLETEHYASRLISFSLYLKFFNWHTLMVLLFYLFYDEYHSRWWHYPFLLSSNDQLWMSISDQMLSAGVWELFYQFCYREDMHFEKSQSISCQEKDVLDFWSLNTIIKSAMSILCNHFE